MSSPSSPDGPSSSHFGDSPLGPVTRLVVGVEPGPVLEVLDLGAIVHRLWVTDADGVRRNVVLGHPTPQDHLDGTAYLGGTIGRFANRIAGSAFELDGRVVEVAPNEGRTSLHGGPAGFDKQRWRVVEHDATRLVLSLTSPDGDQGFPGTLEVTVSIEVAGDEVAWELAATTDAPTPVSLTQHSYFALDGEGEPTADHVLQVPAAAYLPVDGESIPLAGPPYDVAGTPFDLRAGTRVGDLVTAEHPQVDGGLDHDLLLDGSGLREVARLHAPRSGLRLTVSSDQPGLQVFTGQGLAGLPTSDGGRHLEHGGVALEPQQHPDTPNRPDLGDATLRPGTAYRSRIRWRLEPTR